LFDSLFVCLFAHIPKTRLVFFHVDDDQGPLDEQCAKCRLSTLYRLTHVSLAENKFQGGSKKGWIEKEREIESERNL
jgi:hypothetical protein